MAPKELLALTVLGTIIATIGSFFAMVVKDYFFARSFERWKDNRTLETIYRKYRDPIILSSTELCSILIQICENYPPDFLKPNLLKSHPDRMIENSADDNYFQKYKLASSVYRLCAFLGWLELYRQEVVFLDTGRNDLNKKLEESLNEIKNDLADGQINKAEDWLNWSDALLFLEVQRAIGERMIPNAGNSKGIIGYAKFSELFDSEQEKEQDYWIKIATNFFLFPTKGSKDFRIIRIKRLIVHLVNLLELLDKTHLKNKFVKMRKEYQAELLNLKQI